MNSFYPSLEITQHFLIAGEELVELKINRVLQMKFIQFELGIFWIFIKNNIPVYQN